MIDARRLRASAADLAQGAAWVLAAYAGAIGLRAVLQLALARWLGAEALGAYVSAVTLGALLGVLATGGIGAAALRFVPLYDGRRGEGDDALLASFEAFATRWPLVLGLLIGAPSALAIWWMDPGLLPASAVLLLLVVPLTSMLTVQGEVARALGRMALAYLPQQTLPAAATLAGCIVLQLAGALD